MALINKAESLETYSEQVRDVLSRPPKGIVRRGTGIVIIVVGALLALSSIVSYPEMLSGTITISTDPAPGELVMQRGGRISRLLAVEGQQVKAGQVLAELENATRLENVSALNRYMAAVRQFLKRPDLSVPLTANGMTFGDLQTDVNVLIQQSHIYHRLKTDAYLPERIRLLNREIGYHNQMARLNQDQEAINQSEFANIEKKYVMDVRLYREKVYSQAEFLAFENAYLQRKRENETFKKTLIENRLTLAAKEKERLELLQTHTQQLRVAYDALNQSLQNCTNLLQTWQQTYLLTAPSSGRLYSLRLIQPRQSVRAGDTLFTVVPQPSHLIGQAVIRATNRGKLKIGQQVFIRLADYPAEEHGFVIGRVGAISLLPDNYQCRVSVVIETPIITSFGRTLNYRPNLPGTAEIVTERLSLLERSLYGLRRILRRSA